MGSGPDDAYQMILAIEQREAFLKTLIDYLESRPNNISIENLEELSVRSGYMRFANTLNSLRVALNRLWEGDRLTWNLFLGELFEDNLPKENTLRKLLFYSPFGDRLNLIVRTWPNGSYRLITIVDASMDDGIFTDIHNAASRQTKGIQTHIVSLSLTGQRNITTTRLSPSGEQKLDT